jgi:hypothetical protein
MQVGTASFVFLLFPLWTKTLSQVCESNADCKNGGICVTGSDNATVSRCDCTSFYTGALCETECGVLCYNDAECIIDVEEHADLDIGDSDFRCSCKEGWQGFLCTIKAVSCPNGLECLHGGTCQEIGNGLYECECPDGYNGNSCENEVEVPTPTVTPSANTGCFICGDGLVVTKPETIFAFPGQPQVPCGQLEEAGKTGLIPLEQCPFLPPLVADDCGCALSPTASPVMVTNPSSPNSAESLSTGAIAGISVAALFTGMILIAFLVKFRRGSSQKEQPANPSMHLATNAETKVTGGALHHIS